MRLDILPNAHFCIIRNGEGLCDFKLLWPVKQNKEKTVPSVLNQKMTRELTCGMKMSAGNKVAVFQFERWLRGAEIKIEADKWYKSCKPHESPSLFLIPPQPPVYLRGSIISPLKRVHANRTVLNKTSTARLGQQLRAPFPRLTSWLWTDCCFYRPLPPGPH